MDTRKRKKTISFEWKETAPTKTNRSVSKAKSEYSKGRKLQRREGHREIHKPTIQIDLEASNSAILGMDVPQKKHDRKQLLQRTRGGLIAKGGKLAMSAATSIKNEQGLGSVAASSGLVSKTKNITKGYVEILEDKMDALIKNRKKMQANDYARAFSELVDGVDAVSKSGDPKDDARVMQDFTKLLIDEYKNITPKEKRITDAQIEAIDRLVGKTKTGTNYLEQEGNLVFSNFNKNILIAQLLVRVVRPELVRQRQEGVCGVAAFMHSILVQDPDKYVQFVMELAIKGSADMDLGGEKGKPLHIKIDPKLTKRESSHALRARGYEEGEYLDEADFISLVGSRSWLNKIVGHVEQGPQFTKMLYGVTMEGEINQWMDAAGFQNRRNINLNKPSDFKQLEETLKDGGSAIFLTTAYLADYLRDKDARKEKYPSHIMQTLFAGHYIQIKNIHFDETKQEVKMTIVTWGEESANVTMPYDIFKKIKGQSKVITGVTPSMEKRRQKFYEEQSIPNENRYHPVVYLQQIESLLNELNKKDKRGLSKHKAQVYKEYYAKLDKIIKDAKIHKHGLSWIDAAKKTQDIALELSENKTLDDVAALFRPVYNFALNNTICDSREPHDYYLKAASGKADSRIKPENVLLQAIDFNHDVQSFIKLTEIAKDKKALDTCENRLKLACDPKRKWFNQFEAKIAKRALEKAKKRLQQDTVQKKTVDPKSNKQKSAQAKDQDNKKADQKTSFTKVKANTTRSSQTGLFSRHRSNSREREAVAEIKTKITKLADQIDAAARQVFSLAASHDNAENIIDNLSEFSELHEKQVGEFMAKKSVSLSDCKDFLEILELNKEVIDDQLVSLGSDNNKMKK